MKKFYFPLLKFSFLFFLLFSELPTIAQQVVQYSVHFKKNKFALSEDAITILDKVQDTIGEYVIDRIIIKGYTDSDADSAYNSKLSGDRCQSVKTYLVSAGIDSTKISAAFFGEYFPIVENSNENNKSKNRRVDLIITMHIPVIAKIKENKKDTCKGDTLIEVSNGVMMFVNKCNYIQKKNCIHLSVERHVEYKTKVSRFKMKLGLKKYTKTKKVRVEYFVHIECPDSSCADQSTIIYVPTYEVKEKKITVENYDSATGEFSKSRVPKIKSLKKKSYAVIPYACSDGGGKPLCMTICGGVQHCGCRMSKIKFAKGMKVIYISSFAGAEVSVSKDGRTVSFIGEFGIDSLSIVNGTDTISFYHPQISAMRHGLRKQKSCGEKDWFLFMQIRSRHCEYYRRYKFNKTDIEIQQKAHWTITDSYGKDIN
ncbi:hypothetical protein BH09BAC5_BH09BAC5_14630 [soil metagenome]